MNKAKNLFFEDINTKQSYGKINLGRGREGKHKNSIFVIKKEKPQYEQRFKITRIYH